MKETIQVATSHFLVRHQFLQTVMDNIDNPGLLKALELDGVSSEDSLFQNPDEIYIQLNSGGSKTRDWLILKANGLEPHE